MANTTRTYTGNGVTTLYPVDFTLGYISKDDIYVYLDGDVYTDQLSYTWTDNTQIELTTPVAENTKFVIRRVVARNVLVNDYTDGAILREGNLDDSFRQALMALEEVADGYAAPSGAFNLNNDIDMLNHRIKNLASALDDGDAVSFEFLKNYIVNALDVVIIDPPELLSESVTLSAAQESVTFSLVKSAGLAVYLSSVGSDNGRLHEGVHYTRDLGTDEFTISLINTYPEGTILTAYNYTAAGAPIVNQSSGLNDRKVDIVAHRGFERSFPQNTMLAFTSAIRRGATALECDVQITSDGVPVVYHDNTLDSLTNGTGAVKDTALSVVQSAIIDEVSGTPFASARIPKFSELLKYCKGAGIDLFPEIKKYRTSADIELMINDVLVAKMEQQTYFSSFSYSDVTKFRELNKTITVGLLGSSSNPLVYKPIIDDLAALNNTVIIWNYPAILTSPAIVSYAKSRGVDVAAWTVNDNTDAKKLMRVGVTKLITDVKLEVL